MAFSALHRGRLMSAHGLAGNPALLGPYRALGNADHGNNDPTA
jgi:hypothetical protein